MQSNVLSGNIKTLGKYSAFEENFQSFTRSNYRNNLIKLTEMSPSGSQTHAHHVFVQKFNEKFLQKGINIHDPKYLTWWDAKSHLTNAKQYNDVWIDFFIENSNPTKAKILEQGKRMMAEQGIKTNF